MNETHNPELRSWVTSANAADTDFPIQNLPFGVFRRAGSAEAFRVGVAIGDHILDITAAQAKSLFTGDADLAAQACCAPTLNRYMAMGSHAWSALRLALSRVLREGYALQSALSTCLMAQADAEFAVPAQIGDYTDFYTSVHHATNIGKLLRPDNPLLPNYKWIPIGYHGRSSSIGISGQAVRRPVSQVMRPGATEPVLAASTRMDYELEMGIFIGPGNALGEPVSMAQAEQHVFGMCLFNDWSARDVQGWEYQPLGPFLAKNFASTVSPWVVTMEALAPFRHAWTRAAGDPQPLPYLDSTGLRQSGAVAIELEVLIQTEAMRQQGQAPHRLSRSNFRDAYWSVSQMVAHHTVNGCNLQAGDLLGSGTQSGPIEGEAGSLMELSKGGKQALSLPSGETRTFLEDGDTVIFRGMCQAPGAARIGFGEVRGTLLGPHPGVKGALYMLQLYNYFRSSASYRVRIALNLKGLPYEYIPVHLLKDGGQQHASDYQRINPAELVPALVDDGRAIGQSLAIMEYLDETHPEPALLPRDAMGRARVRALAQSVACEIHPLNNLRVLQYLEHDLKVDEATKATWYRHWITLGFTAIEAMLANNPNTGTFCHGDTPGLADCCLIPQIANSRRFETPLEAFPTIRRIESACLALEAFAKAAPALQPDAV